MLRPSQRPSATPNSSRPNSPSPYTQPVLASAHNWPHSRGSSPPKMSRGAYDPELPGSPTGAGRLARRWFTRKSRWIFGALLSGGVVLYYLDAVPRLGPHRRPHHGHHGHGPGHGPPGGGDRMSDIWDGEGESHGPPQGWGLGWIGGGGAKDPPPDHELPFVVNEYGDHFYPDYVDTSRIPPFDPDLSQIPPPASFFPEISISAHLRPPTETPFPEESINEIVANVYPQAVEGQFPEMAEDAFSKSWQSKDGWDSRGEVLPKVQWDGFKKGKYESKAEKKERVERKEAVRRGFVHAWQAYKDHAWGYDEIKPVSLQPSDPFNNWGASIIDTLDTILLMDLPEEYTLCRPHVNQVNFHWLGGKDWKQGYSTPPANEQHLLLSDDGQPLDFMMPRETQTNFAVFETGIRYLGGLLSGYDLSGDKMLLVRAVHLGNILAMAFNTEYGLPMGRMDPGMGDLGHWYKLHTVSIAEVGSMTLELTRLSQLTGDRKYYDFAQRAIDYLEQKVIPKTKFKPLIPLWITPSSAGDMIGTVAWGGLADSYYEYLIKQYKLLGGGVAAEQYKRLYIDSLEMAKDVLFHDITVIPDRELLAIGKVEGKHAVPEVEHLTCFAGGMMGLGSRLLDRPDDMEDAQKFAKTCYWLAEATPTGLQPEGVTFMDNEMVEMENVTMNGDHYHPHWESVDLEEAAEKNLLHTDRNDVLRWNGDNKPVFPDDGGREEPGPIEYYPRLRNVPAGAQRVSVRGINRPETIESIFYMYRLTGDRKWQNRGWKMFTSWAQIAKVAGGMSSIYDVTKEEYHWSDNMESFTFAETFKYHYLLHCDPDHMSLDDYVLSTEAHPFIANPSITPGSQGFWKPPKSQNLGVQGRGTHAQMWTRLAHIKEKAKTYSMAPLRVEGISNNSTQQGGGRGMGGGGGDPAVRPRPPPEYDSSLRKAKLAPARLPAQEGEAEDED